MIMEENKMWGLYPEEEIKNRKKVTITDIVNGASLFKSGVLEKTEFDDIIMEYVSNDENVIPNVLKILNFERKRKEELLNNTSFELSRALVAFEFYEKNTPSNLKQKKWIVSEIKKHFIKWKEYIRCNFNVKDLP